MSWNLIAACICTYLRYLIFAQIAENEELLFQQCISVRCVPCVRLPSLLFDISRSRAFQSRSSLLSKNRFSFFLDIRRRIRGNDISTVAHDRFEKLPVTRDKYPKADGLRKILRNSVAMMRVIAPICSFDAHRS